eukprot:TRINITY_DN1981_c0_g1_i1.p1 TRINITY_DN1981_c0_g1~~TRINITY_DN1981_c0_g1_i1.p1  ORF type:complete len:634 (+),score=124.28 TRINITY_DN1981_c0_g1_i1:122-1903(+)
MSRLSATVRTGRSTRPSRSFDAQSDVLVVGCGIAGCSAALRAAEEGLKVTVLSSSREPLDSNSYWAQGGIIYKGRKGEDSASMLEDDIKYAGAGKCVDSAVSRLASDGPRRVKQLLLGGLGKQGSANVPFDRDAQGNLKVCLEASHSAPRIIHWKDHTGRAITEELVQTVLNHPNITIRTATTAIDALLTPDGRCIGALALENAPGIGSEFRYLGARSTVLATGGLGALYTNTSNPASARGDGIAFALRAGADLANLEYVQFHPTTLYRSPEQRQADADSAASQAAEGGSKFLEQPQSFLITEAMRGAGAKLRNPITLRLFAKDYHPLGELAPRDVVTRLIWAEMSKYGLDHVLLDPSASGQSAAWIRDRFPSINAHCESLGIDFTASPGFPVVPAQHYACGGISVDLEGRTSVPGLYAAGEVACTGLHGANRLASTSLLEGLTWGASAAEAIKHTVEAAGDEAFPSPLLPKGAAHIPPAGDASAEELWQRMQEVMWKDVGIIRTCQGLTGACAELGKLAAEAEALYHLRPQDADVIKVRNGLATALAVARSAAANPVSTGAHYIEGRQEATPSATLSPALRVPTVPQAILHG